MKLPFSLVRWLAFAFLVDWLVARTLTRSAIFMPKAPVVIVVYQALGLLGQFSATLAGLLALISLFWLAWQGFQARSTALPASGLLLLAGLSIIFLFFPAQGWLSTSSHLILVALIVWISLRIWEEASEFPAKLAGGLVALALLVSQAYLLIPALSDSLRLPGTQAIDRYLFLVGELLVVLAPIVLWWAYARHAPRWTWLAAALPALSFIGMKLAVPAMAGILAIWSTGLTLYLPWPVYAFSLWAACVTAIDCLRRSRAAGWAVLLLAAAGYAPQLSSQAILGLIALWLLVPGNLAETEGASLRWSQEARLRESSRHAA